ncbi:hypothetical protein [Methylobacterium sp. E-045]|uniref:hypothetical protein n=1 Tax=Methylobacterium sp. E-045 TaxID=2836575 RepID=UPI001FB9534D|nr:hypothetical protein [Methylobacterium sp. E-045]MCJ2131955.1 hypothetical protein [Methylobacterium sp. E-045]
MFYVIAGYRWDGLADIIVDLDLRTGPGTAFPVARRPPAGMRVEPIARDGRWLGVGVLNAQGQPSQTGGFREHDLS